MIKWWAVILCLILIGCAAQTTQPQKIAPNTVQPARANKVATPSPVAEAIKTCTSTEPAQHITKVSYSFDSGLDNDSKGFTIRILPMNDNGDIVPANGTVTITVWSSDPDKPTLTDFKLYSRSFYVKTDDMMSDCGPRPMKILWSAIKQSDQYRYVKLPNYGIISVEYSRTGSAQIWEKRYNAVEHDQYMFTT